MTQPPLMSAQVPNCSDHQRPKGLRSASGVFIPGSPWHRWSWPSSSCFHRHWGLSIISLKGLSDDSPSVFPLLHQDCICQTESPIALPGMSPLSAAGPHHTGALDQTSADLCPPHKVEHYAWPQCPSETCVFPTSLTCTQSSRRLALLLPNLCLQHTSGQILALCKLLLLYVLCLFLLHCPPYPNPPWSSSSVLDVSL